MPKFDVLTINQKHLARVNVVRSEINVSKELINDTEDIWSFELWRRYIRRQLKETKALTSIVVEHIFE
jgi:hypothetical protein